MKAHRAIVAATFLASAASLSMLSSCVKREPPPAIEAPPPPETKKTSVTCSHYADSFAGKKTASGEIYSPSALTAAHKTLPFGTKVRVSTVEGGKSVIVRINDRGPFVKGRELDLSKAAAQQLGVVDDGVVEAQLEILSKGEPAPAR